MMNNLINRDLLLQAIQATATKDKQLLSMGASVNDITAFYPYYADDKEMFVKVRIDKDGKKWIKPFYFNGNRYQLGEPPAYKGGQVKKPLYIPKPLADTVYLVEGEKCVHTMMDIMLSATTTGGATSVDKCDLTPLIGRKCVLWRDNDPAGEKWQDELMTALNTLKIAYEVIDITGVMMPNGESLPAKADCYDFIQANYQDGNDDVGICELIYALPRLDLTAMPASDTDGADDYKQELALIENQILEAVAEIAKLSDIQQIIAIGKTAKAFNIPKDKLTALVNERIQGDFIPEISPYHEAVSGKMIFNELYGLIDNYICIDKPFKVAFALWVIMTYLTDIAEILPIAWITAPEKACGKSTLLGLFARVVNKPYESVNPSQAVFYRIVERYRPTLLLDEIDNYLKDNKELLTVINAGYSLTACKVARVNMDKSGAIESYNVFGARVFSGIGNMVGTFASRAIRFEMKRKGKDDKTKRLNHRTLPKAHTDELQRKIKRWAMDNRQAVQNTDIMQIDIKDRDFDNWYILLQIAHVIGVYDEALRSCLSICQVEHEPSLNEQLLMDIRENFTEPKLFGEILLQRLTDDPNLQWQTYNRGQPLSNHQLIQKLKLFGIKPKKVRIGNVSKRGYELSIFQAVFDRYLPPPTQSNDCDIWE